MKTTILILSVVCIVSPNRQFASRSADLDAGHYSSQNRSRVPVVDEIFQACGPIFFQPGSLQISDDDERCLVDIKLRLQTATNYQIVIDGHRVKSERKTISLARAKRARDYLVTHEVNISQTIVRDFGDSCPHESGDQRLNRRVEFTYWRKSRGLKTIATSCAPGAKPRFEILK